MNRYMRYCIQKYNHKLLIFFTVFLCLSSLSNAENNAFTVKLLEKELLQGTEDTLQNSFDIFSKAYVFKAVVEIGADSLPTLTKALSMKSPIKRMIGGIGLGILGDKEAIERINSEVNKANEDQLQYIYLMAIAGRGSSSDLSRVVKAVNDKENRKLSNMAAFALAMLRPDVIQKENIALSKDLNDLLELIPVRGQQTKFETDNPNNTLIAQLVSHGIPRMNERRLFIDTERNQTWRLQGDTWYCSKGVEASRRNEEISMHYKTAHISFSTYISTDQTRALVDVGLTFGGLNGSGFFYSLIKNDGKWQINFMSQTWIS